MKKSAAAILTILCLFTIPSGAMAGTLERTASMPWGSGIGQVGLQVVPDGRQGPQDLAFDGSGTLWVLDTANVRAFPVGTPAAARAVQPAAVLMSFNGRHIATVSAGGRLEELDPSLGIVSMTTGLPYPTALSHHAGLPELAAGGSGVPVGPGFATALVERPGFGSVVVTGRDGAAASAYSIALPGLVSLTPLGVRPDGSLAVEAQTAPGGIDRGVSRNVIIVTQAGKVTAALELPRMKFAVSRRDLALDADGAVHVMLSTPAGAEIWRWDGAPGAAFPGGYFATTARPGDGLAFAQPVPTPRPAPDTPVTRSQALANAKTFNDHVWTATLKNITTTTCTDWCGNAKTIDAPDWVVEGQNTRFPYCWGGFSSVDAFDQGLLADKKAGDIQTKYDSGASACGSSCAVGVDCSGFVSRCWTCGQHYGTSQMSTVTTAIQKSELKPADALNNPSSHIRLFVALRGDGNWDMVESYAGSGYWGVGFTVRTPADNSAYDAVRYNLIQEDTPQPHDPPTIAHTPPGTAAAGQDVTIATTVTTSTGQVAAYNLRYRNAGQPDFTIATFADKGGGTWDAIIPAAAVTPGTIEYYLAIWDGETPVQDGRNRVTLPADAETAQHYFTLIVEAPDAGTPDAGTPDADAPDAGKADAAEPDVGGEPDAGRHDAGAADAGQPQSDAGPACEEGKSRCSGDAAVEVCSGGAWHAAAACGAGTQCAAGECVAAAPDAGAGAAASHDAGTTNDSGGGCSCAIIKL